jgi:hypothetical protein
MMNHAWRLFVGGFAIAITGFAYYFWYQSSTDPWNERLQRHGGPFEIFGDDRIRIMVPRFPESFPRFTGDIIEGKVHLVIGPDVDLRFEEVATGCGCTVVRPVQDETNPRTGQAFEFAFSVNTAGRIGTQNFPLLFRFRDNDGIVTEYQAGLKLFLNRAIDVPPVLDSVNLENGIEVFAITYNLRSKLPNIQWDAVNVVVAGGTANVSVRPLGNENGVSQAEMRLSGRIADVNNGGLTIVFESPQFKEQPRTIIPFVHEGERLVWKPDALEFRRAKSLPKLIVQPNFDCSPDELSLVVDSPKITHKIKQVGKLFVVEFAVIDNLPNMDQIDSSGVIRLIRRDNVVAEIPYFWSGT